MGTVAANSRIGHLAGILSSAQARLRELQSRGVRLGERSFENCFEPSLAALEAIRSDREMSIQSL